MRNEGNICNVARDQRKITSLLLTPKHFSPVKGSIINKSVSKYFSLLSTLVADKNFFLLAEKLIKECYTVSTRPLNNLIYLKCFSPFGSSAKVLQSKENLNVSRTLNFN